MTHSPSFLQIARRCALGACAVLAAAVVANVGKAAAQVDRIWGQVHTTSGERHEGFLLWNGPGSHDGTNWADILDGTRATDPEHYEAWLSATGRTRPVRAVELRGYRVSWNEDDPDYPDQAATGIRFGWLSAVNVPESGGIELVLRSDSAASSANASASPPSSATSPPPLVLVRPRARTRALEVDEPNAGTTRVEWRDLRRVEFGRPPAGARPRSARLHGTVEDRLGRPFTGYVAWDSDEVLESDVLDGWDEDDEDREIPFADIRSIARGLSGARVVLASGEVLNLTGTNDVNRDNRGILVFDPRLGMVQVEWEEFGIVRFHPPADAQGWDAFAGAASRQGDEPTGRRAGGVRRLAGVVTTRQGERLEGLIRWDAEHEWSWELLHGESEGVTFAVEFGAVARIGRPAEDDAIVVSLVDGRVLELSAGDDSEGQNRGVFVLPDASAGASAEAARWRYVAWEDFAEVRFHGGADVRAPSDPGAGVPGSFRRGARR